MARLRKYIKIFIALVLPLYLLILANSMRNMHIHILSNGMVVKHAHPFNHNKSGEKKHHHNSCELSFYDGFFLDFFDNSTPLSNIAVNLPLLDKIEEKYAIDYTQVFYNFSLLRAPPFA